MNMPAVASAPPMNVVTRMPRVSVITPATTDMKNVEPMARAVMAAGGERRESESD